VDQAEKIKKFVPEPYWRVQATMVDPEDAASTYKMKWCRGKIFEKAAVMCIHNRL
jgi:DNA topoisomerase IA